MEIMQQQSANHLDGRWRPHLLPYTSGHTLSSLPNLHDHVRQQMISQQSDQQQPQSPIQHSNSHLQQQPQSPIQHSSSHLQQQLQLPHPMSSHRLDSQLQQQTQQQHNRHLIDPRSETKELLPPLLIHSNSSNNSSSSSRRGEGSGGGRRDGLPSPSVQMNSLTLQSSPSSASPSTPPTPSPSTPSPGKSGGKDGEEKKGEEWEQYNAGAAFLGPTLWDKTLSYDSDLKVSLEYMDLDEFLNENGIPIEEGKRHNSSPGGGSGGSTNVGMGNSNSLRVSQNLSPEAPSSPETSSPHMGSGMGACPQGARASANSMAQAAAVAATNGGTVLSSALSPQDYVGDCSSSVSSPGSPDPHSPLQVLEQEGARASQGRDVVAASRRGLNEKIMGSIASATALSTADGGLKSEVRHGLNLSPNDLALATVHGQDFDPRTRCFSEEELKPQPMIKKSRKQFVPAELKDDKYWARRRKNNLAAKRSRDARRLKENQIAMRANFLEKENMGLRLNVNEASRELELLKTRLGKYEEVGIKTVIEMKAILPICKYNEDFYEDDNCTYDEDMCKYEEDGDSNMGEPFED